MSKATNQLIEGADDSRRCRICLTTNPDDKVVFASCYVEIFKQLMTEDVFMCETDYKKLWLCMWCKSTLKRVLTLRELAKASDKILNSQNGMLNSSDTHRQRNHIPSLSVITHLHIPLVCRGEDNVTLNVNENLNVNNEFGKTSDEQNLPILNEILYEEPVIIEYFNEENENQNETDQEISNCEKNYENENEILIKDNKMNNNEIKIKCKRKQKLHIKSRSKRNKTLIQENFVKVQQNKKMLKLEELKFAVKYLSFAEQLKEIEIKKMKYKDMKFQCDFCGMGFSTSDYLEEHIVRHTKAAGLHKCDVCELHFKTAAVLSHHRLSHKRLFLCLICGMMITKWSNCFVHRYKCGASVTYVECHICSKIFSDEYSLKVHMKVHNVNKQYICEHCSKIFATKQRMIVHIRTHTGQKPFTCEHCDRSFTTNSNLKAHYLVHSDESKHYCVECDTHYKTAKSLKRHLNESVRHVRERPHQFKCKECPKEFSTLKTLYHHSSRHSTADHVKCCQCDKIFSNKSNLRKHLKCIHKNVSTTV